MTASEKVALIWSTHATAIEAGLDEEAYSVCEALFSRPLAKQIAGLKERSEAELDAMEPAKLALLSFPYALLTDPEIGEDIWVLQDVLGFWQAMVGGAATGGLDYAHVNPPASAEDLAFLAESLSVPVPLQLQAVYEAVNGFSGPEGQPVYVNRKDLSFKPVRQFVWDYQQVQEQLSLSLSKARKKKLADELPLWFPILSGNGDAVLWNCAAEVKVNRKTKVERYMSFDFNHEDPKMSDAQVFGSGVKGFQGLFGTSVATDDEIWW